MPDKPLLLGDILIQQELVSQDVVDKALKIQAGGTRRLGHILVLMKAITEDQLADALAEQIETAVCNIEAEFSPEVNKILPRYLCRQYGVLPLSFQADNVLEVAMANPADYDAINDLEHYTGKVINANLARNSDIEREIPKRIPLGVKDILSPQATNSLTKIVATLALVFTVCLGIYTYDFIQRSRYGSVSTSDGTVRYQHHDLTLAVDNTGKFSLMGHGAYADGLYKISFNNLNNLNEFVKQHENDFSDLQNDWLKWAIKQAGSGVGQKVLTQK